MTEVNVEKRSAAEALGLERIWKAKHLDKQSLCGHDLRHGILHLIGNGIFVRVRQVHAMLSFDVVEDADLALLMTLLLGGCIRGSRGAHKRDEQNGTEIHGAAGSSF